jgi:hypothetical protein
MKKYIKIKIVDTDKEDIDPLSSPISFIMEGEQIYKTAYINADEIYMVVSLKITDDIYYYIFTNSFFYTAIKDKDVSETENIIDMDTFFELSLNSEKKEFILLNCTLLDKEHNLKIGDSKVFLNKKYIDGFYEDEGSIYVLLNTGQSLQLEHNMSYIEQILFN